MGYEAAPTRGTLSHYGQRKVNQTFGGVVTTSGHTRLAKHVIDLAEIVTGAPSTSNVLASGATHNMAVSIPAYSRIKSCTISVVEALATTGGSAAASASLTVGLEQADGTDIDLDGLLDATDGALTIASNDIAQPRGSYLMGNAAALIRNFQYDGDTTGAPVDVTQVELVSIGANAGELYVLLTIDDVTDMTAVAGKISIEVEYVPEAA